VVWAGPSPWVAVAGALVAVKEEGTVASGEDVQAEMTVANRMIAPKVMTMCRDTIEIPLLVISCGVIINPLGVAHTIASAQTFVKRPAAYVNASVKACLPFAMESRMWLFGKTGL
jgi:hypothetical protein